MSDEHSRADLVAKLLHPKSIAIVGASNDPVKLSGRPVDYLRRFGYTGRILPINRGRETVQGLPAYPSLADAPAEIDLAMVMLPAAEVAECLRDCQRHGVSVAIVAAAGFAEASAKGAELQAELQAVVRETGVRVLGPNCLGAISVAERAVPTFTSALDEDMRLRSGPIGFVSQSGAFGSFIFSAAQRTGIGFTHYLNTGNEADLSVAEVLDALLDTADTKVLLAYLEGVTDGRRLLEVARRANELDKPILAVKVGSSAAGARAAQSHTASLAGADTVFDGAARQFGIVRLSGMDPLLDAARLFAAGRRARGNRLSTLSLSGGAGVLMADAAAAHGIDVPVWDEQWQQAMAEVIPPFGSARNPIDLTATLISDPPMLRRSLRIAVTHPDTDLIAVLLGNADRGAEQLVDAIEEAYQATDRPFVVVWTGGNGRPAELLAERGIPCYSDPGRAAAALGALVEYGRRPPVSTPCRPTDVDSAAARAVVASARAAGQRVLDEYTASQLIAAYGIPRAEYRVVAGPDAAVAAAAELAGPVAVKLRSSKVPHKSDIGGVRLGLTTAAEVWAAAEQVLRAEPSGELLVQRMAEPGTELILGIQRDPAFGPVVLAGFGGVLAELLADSKVAVAPIDARTATDLLCSLRGAALFDGVRGGQPVDLDAVADALARLSWLAHDLADDLVSLDVNPLVVGAGGAIAVDCLAELG
ncbi:acyl-CoA synthetase (NDP forming) [Tamaricihabitans halophyticus]|uniref:Acyl-CoA synthetase (NDP forming) n=1 Tax=Tamaricihabitans halophyticus TaxID=1262583 RepID=A0A4R2RC05_9PSEU|nr:acetate--CoA ligase family protein [Tamaricihabitans halophyticus]TCP57251.1 acyl-CoA synthetase (NDP forming) [Tamaricihabitans halophyticus]